MRYPRILDALEVINSIKNRPVCEGEEAKAVFMTRGYSSEEKNEEASSSFYRVIKDVGLKWYHSAIVLQAPLTHERNVELGILYYLGVKNKNERFVKFLELSSVIEAFASAGWAPSVDVEFEPRWYRLYPEDYSNDKDADIRAESRRP
jgi:hypothetical protein